MGGTSTRRSSSGRVDDHLVGRLERRPELAEEHRSVDPEVEVVAAVERVEVERPLALEVLPVRLDRPLVSDDRRRCRGRTGRRYGSACGGGGLRRARGCAAGRRLAAPARGAATSPSGGCTCAEGRGGARRPLLPCARAPPRARSIASTVSAPDGRLAGREVPELPRRAVHERLGEQRRDVEVVGEPRVDVTHRRCVCVVPDRAILGRNLGGIPVRERFDESAFDRRRAVGELQCTLATPRTPRSRCAPCRPRRTPPTACCSSARPRTRFPTAPLHTQGRAPPPFGSSARTRRGCSRSTTRGRGRTSTCASADEVVTFRPWVPRS